MSCSYTLILEFDQGLKKEALKELVKLSLNSGATKIKGGQHECIREA
jgi:hypothetical protein